MSWYPCGSVELALEIVEQLEILLLMYGSLAEISSGVMLSVVIPSGTEPSGSEPSGMLASGSPGLDSSSEIVEHLLLLKKAEHGAGLP